MECAEGGVLRICGAICDAWLHGTVEEAGEEFRSRYERELDGSLLRRGGVAHWLAGLYFRPWGLIVSYLGW